VKRCKPEDKDSTWPCPQGDSSTAQLHVFLHNTLMQKYPRSSLSQSHSHHMCMPHNTIEGKVRLAISIC
jgi:protein required for attachment to host cells